MKKIILSILVIAGIASLQSCKDQFEDQLVETKTESKIASKEAMRKVSDSTANLKSIDINIASVNRKIYCLVKYF
ncbi:hypothetical protein ABIE26_000217 [Pedobacter africanus]|uniref:Uncharacterized protein n=1 Tax=Pedobacter africanus TaxID=151894 RepID=A0ACC6KV96_9SPHI|nr:hypothetical protein [Pedobacter africanus]MDR6783295.1 hypothetical protein [Pedobacter africanus]